MGTRSHHIGRTRVRLAELITKAFADMGRTVKVDPAWLDPAQGAWRTNTALDVMRWEGQLNLLLDDGITWSRRNIDSWDKMTDCVKKGIVIDQEGSSFLASAK